MKTLITETPEEQPQTLIYLIAKEDLKQAIREEFNSVLQEYFAEKEKEHYLSVKQASTRLGVDKSTLWRWERSHYLMPTRVGKSVRYRESDIVAIEEGLR